jgi:hypothetical protein
MIYRRRQLNSVAPGGFFRLQNAQRHVVYGYGDGDFIRLRDEFGNTWRGTATKQYDESIRFRFRDQRGATISGISDSFGVILRDEHGRTWRGFFD